MEPIKRNVEESGNNVFSSLTFRYLPYWPLFLSLMLLCGLAAWAYLQLATPLYEAYATILIKDEKKGAEESSAPEALNIYASKKIVENEVEVLHSRKLMKEVVNELHLYAPVYEKGEYKNTSAYLSSPVIILVKNPDALSGIDENGTKPIDFYIKNNEVVMNSKSYPLNQWVTTPFGELQFAPNPRKQKAPLKPLCFRLFTSKDRAIALLKILKVEPSSKLSSVVNLTIRDEVPKRGEDVLNKLIELYNSSALIEKNRLAANTLAFVDNRLHAVERELDSLESRIQHYRSKKGVVDLTEQSKVFLQNVGTNDRKAADISMQLAVLDQVERYIISKDNESGIVPSTLGVDDPVLSRLMANLNEAEMEYEKLKKTTAENNPLVITVAREIEKLRPLILENVRNQRNSLQSSKSNLNVSNSMFNSMLQSIPEKERELAEISRQHTIKNSVYSFLLEKREQTALTISSTFSESRVVDVAESSSKPVSPIAALIYLAALVLALGIGMALITVKEKLNRKILFLSEIESSTKIPVAAEIAHTKKRDSLLVTGSKVSFVAEQFRQLRAAIGLYGKHINKKKLLVTSSISGEGKSFISTNLATSLALAGKKVVLIDLDIRNPKSSSLLGVAGEEGIGEFLAGTKHPEDIIRKSSVPNLYVIGAGGEVENAEELMLSGKLTELLSYLEEPFDFIVMDSSPIDPVTDASILSEYCDKTLFVVRHAYTPKTAVQHFDDNQKVKALKNPSIVFNGVRSRGFFVKTYGYGYGYGYASMYRVKATRAKKVTRNVQI
ncbi:MAG: polysaccharide biosynthesis tyrosine autokinase [Flavisolibacter sp.]|nr:polysaccharide biosynthesis tyrosine autokinase [Flavisolibacter sp.]